MSTISHKFSVTQLMMGNTFQYFSFEVIGSNPAITQVIVNYQITLNSGATSSGVVDGIYLLQ